MLHTSPNQNFVKVTKVFLDSLDRESGNVSKYRVRLPFHISNVVGASLRAYSFPGNIFTSFTRSVNDSLDFILIRQDDYQATFTVTWEPKVYEYSNGNIVDYCFTLQTMLQNAVAGHPVFGITGTHPVDFEVLPSPEKKTFIRVTGNGLIEVKILSGTGPSFHRSAASIMGFDALDLTFRQINGVVQVKSPNPVNLYPPKSIDLFIEEFSKDVFGRFYLDSEDRVQVDNTLSRVSLLEIPIRTLKELSIRLEVLGQPIETLRENEHNLSLTVFSLNEEINVPAWVLQNFSN